MTGDFATPHLSADLPRNFLRPFRGVHKRLLSGYVAICEFSLNLKCVTSDFISTLVAKKLPLHSV